MPYIEKTAREIAVPNKIIAETPGELNYLFTRSIVLYLKDQGLSYQTINDVIGALEGAKLEFYRRVAVPYEEKKRKLNGDVYP